MINRRSFFSMLAGVPFVGAWIAPKPPVKITFTEMTWGIFNPENESVVRWISVDERLPELDVPWDEWTIGEPKELIHIGKMSRQLLVSSGESGAFGFCVKEDGENPHWVIPDRHGCMWESAITHWAHHPKPIQATQPQKDSAWKRLTENHIRLRTEVTPDDEKTHAWSVTFVPIKERTPIINREVLLSGPNRTYIGNFSERTKETTHWAYLPILRPSEPA